MLRGTNQIEEEIGQWNVPGSFSQPDMAYKRDERVADQTQYNAASFMSAQFRDYDFGNKHSQANNVENHCVWSGSVDGGILKEKKWKERSLKRDNKS